MCYFHAFNLQSRAFASNQENKDSEELWDWMDNYGDIP